MMNAAAPRVGGERIAPMPEAASTPPPWSLGYSALRRIGQVMLPSVTVVATPEPGHRAQQEPRSGGGPAGPRAGAPERREAHVDEELPRARVLQHGPVDREQHDVGGGHVERHAEDALEPHVGLAHEAVQAVAPVAHLPARRDLAAEVGVGQEQQADGRQDPADRAARGLQHEQDGGHAEDQVERVGLDRAAHELVEDDERVAQGHDGQHREQPVGDAGALAGRRLALGALGGLAPSAVDQERHGQGHGQEGRAVDLGGQRVEDPVEGVQRQPDAGGRDQEPRDAREPPSRALALEVLGQLVGADLDREPCSRSSLHGQRPGGARARRRAARAGRPTTSVRRPVLVAISGSSL